MVKLIFVGLNKLSIMVIIILTFKMFITISQLRMIIHSVKHALFHYKILIIIDIFSVIFFFKYLLPMHILIILDICAAEFSKCIFPHGLGQDSLTLRDEQTSNVLCKGWVDVGHC